MGLKQVETEKAAFDRQVASLEEHGVYGLIPTNSVPTGQRVIGTRWVNEIKGDSTYRCRLVVQGWFQVPGTYCGCTFAPVSRLQSVPIMLAIAAEPDYEMFMLEIWTAFLNAIVEEDVIAKVTPCDKIADTSAVPLVMKLMNSLYSVRQSTTNWFGTKSRRLA